MNRSNDLQKQHSIPQTQPKHKHIRITNMKTTIISRILLTLGLVLVLGSAITSVHGGTQSNSDAVPGSLSQQLPVVTIHSIDNVTRGKTGTFVLAANPRIPATTTFVKFSVSGTAIQGVDYTLLVSPAAIGQSGFGAILVKTLPNPRGSADNQAYSVVVTLEPAPGYALGEPSSAEMFIKP
jgi:hypothetical protein